MKQDRAIIIMCIDLNHFISKSKSRIRYFIVYTVTDVNKICVILSTECLLLAGLLTSHPTQGRI